jgi:hypothetical protein
MAGSTDNNQLKLAAKTRWRWQQQFVDDNEDDDDDDDNNKHDKHDDDNNEDDEQDDKDDKHDKHDDNKHDDDDHDDDDVDDKDDDNNNNKADTATSVGGNDNGCNSDGRGHRQQSTKIGSKDTVVVATAIC